MRLDVRFHGRFPFFVEFLTNNPIWKAMPKNMKIMSCLKKHGEQNTKFFQDALKDGNEPRIVPSDLQGEFGFTPNDSPKTRIIRIDIPLLKGHHWSKVCEKTFLKLPPEHEIRKTHPKPVFNSVIWEEIITTTLLHELVHFANHDKGVFPPADDERGFKFERCAKLKTPLVPESEIEDFNFWAKHNTIEKPLFPIQMPRL